MAGLVDLRGKLAVVTGGASGIGRGIAEELIDAGATVVIADVEENAVRATADAIGATPVVTDVSDLASVQALADTIIARHGRVDIVCNNAGVGSMAAIADMTADDWKWMLGVNLNGVIYGTTVFLPHLIANADGGHFVNTASVGGFATMPMLGAYSVSKFGVVALSETLAQELAVAHPKVGVSILAPGPVRSNIGKSRRNRPATFETGGLADVELDDMPEAFGGAIPWLEPRDAGRIVVEAIRTGRLYATTHPEMFGASAGARHRAIAEAFR